MALPPTDTIVHFPRGAGDHAKEIYAASRVVEYLSTHPGKIVAVYGPTLRQCRLTAHLVEQQATRTNMQIQTEYPKGPCAMVTFKS
jgi:hypothetical protein